MKTDVPLKYASLAADVNRLFGAVNTDGGAMVYQLMYRLDTLIPVMVIDGLDDTIVDMAISGNTLFILGKTQLYRVDIE